MKERDWIFVAIILDYHEEAVEKEEAGIYCKSCRFLDVCVDFQERINFSMVIAIFA